MAYLSGRVYDCPRCGVIRLVDAVPAVGSRPLSPRHHVCLLIDEFRRWHHEEHCVRRGLHLCLKCGYDVQYLRSHECPECGTSISYMHRPPAARPFISEAKPITDEFANSIIPPSGAGRMVYGLLRDSGQEASDALLHVLKMLPRIHDRPLCDEMAREILPQAKSCQALYEKLREIGHDPVGALRRILPHVASYAR